MTMSPGSPGPTDFEGKEVPPYEGRRETADVDSEQEKLHRDGANVGAATGPVETDDRTKAPEPADTSRGAVASPAEEQPAAETPSGDSGPASVGPAHYAGTTRGEDVSEDKHDQGGPEKAADPGDGL
jgi:hypothetical protein